MNRVSGIIRVVAATGLGLLLCGQALASQSRYPGAGTVLLNGAPLGRAVVFPPESHGRPFLPVAALRLAIDGPEAVSRLKLRDRTLSASDTGGCSGCALRVKRPVVISGRVLLHGGEAWVPLDDVIRALEATVHGAPDTVRLEVGACDWCILAPRR